ncbi:cytochrome C oxidase subunit IV family protein [Skermanella rosea]|uniref:cytochrome C oxidase subunit IV family protein n=1 Tax=Skermanella rosea TaxID=1817965 RepID=UPI00193421CD|nr:cytochrome C oxidase subunit IV family protein [Skermanella rosea]UEM02435.1 cytochrome C oxidase subunit IV family protein [Skermanella rosea]
MTVLTRTWGLLMALAAVSLLAGRPGDAGTLGPLGSGLVLMAANFKADRILTHFLGLRSAGSGWRMLFRVMLTLLGMAIFAIHALTPIIAAASR